MRSGGSDREAEGAAAGVYCRDCDRLYIVNRSDHWSRWLCTAHKTAGRPNFIGGGVEEPYKLCRYINANGDCPDYIEGRNTLNPRETPDETE